MVELGYGIAYRVLDAQYCRVDGFWRAVPQRRRRVFVVGHLGDWRRAAAVLFERASLLGDNPPRRQSRERVAQTISARTQGGGGLGTDFDLDGGLIHCANVAPTLNAAFGDKQGLEDQHINGGGRCSLPLTAMCLNAGGMGRQDADSETLIPTNRCFFDEVAHSLRADGFDASEDGTGRGTPLVPVAFSCKDHGADAGVISPTLRAMGHAGSHANAGGQVAIAIQERAVSTNMENGPQGSGIRDDGAAYTLEARHHVQAVAFESRFARNGRGAPEEICPPLKAESGETGIGDASPLTAYQTGGGWAVRRLTPTECERLQGFPDGYTNIPWRGKDGSPDGPRYKALGNSMAVNVMRWIGTRIEMVENMNLSANQAAE